MFPMDCCFKSHLWRVINDYSLPEISAKNVEVLDVVSVDTYAVLPEQPVLDPPPLRVQQVHQFVCVHLEEE